MFIDIIKKALERYYQEDYSVLSKGKFVKEECINHRIAMYIQDELIKAHIIELNEVRQKIISGEVKIDLEYDKSIDQDKLINGKKSRPDIIIHHREDNSFNYAFIEIKKRKRTKKDINKCLGAKCNPYNYSNVFIIEYLKKTINKVKILKVLNVNGEAEEYGITNNNIKYISTISLNN